jgi:hypothetical protein
LNGNGDPMSRPAGWDPHFCTQQGGGTNPFLAQFSLPNFKIGGIWDAQRLGGAVGRSIPGYVDFANVNIGLFAAASGLPLSYTLAIANNYASVKFNFGDQPMDGKYPSLRSANVFDIKLGFALQASAAICTRQ